MRTMVSEVMVLVGTGCAVMWAVCAALGLTLLPPAAAAIGCGLIAAGCIVEGAA